jgi:hypothetical protein
MTIMLPSFVEKQSTYCKENNHNEPGACSSCLFTLYALKVDRVQEQGLTYDGLLQALQGQVLAAASLVGLFQRVPE